MWFQVYKFSVSCTAAKYFFICCRTRRRNVLVTTSGFLLLSSSSRSITETNTWPQHKIPKIQAPGDTFSTFSDKVRPEGEHEKCCRFLVHWRECTKELILSGLPNLGSMETFGARHKNETSTGKKRRQTCPHWLCCRDLFRSFVGSATQVYELPARLRFLFRPLSYKITTIKRISSDLVVVFRAPSLHRWPLGYVAGLCGETTTLARCGDRKNAYRNACATYQMHLDCDTLFREVCTTCDIVVRFVDGLATFAWVFFRQRLCMTHFWIIIVYPVCFVIYLVVYYYYFSCHPTTCSMIFNMDHS